MNNLSVEQFNAQMDDAMTSAKPTTGYDLRTAIGKGANFEVFVAQTILESESFPVEFEEVTVGQWGGAGDLRCDLWLEDEARKHVLIVQCKFRKPRSPAKEEDYASFLTAWQIHKDPEWVRANGNEDVRLHLDGFAERLADGWTVEYRYVTTARLKERNFAEFSAAEAVARTEHPSISISAYGHEELKDYFQQMLAMDADIPAEVEFKIREGLIVEKDTPRKTLICVIKGNELRNLYGRYQQSLYSRNVREYLGNNKVNVKITASAKNSPSDFFYLNNGISALCTGYERLGTTVTAANFQIINGAQTVSSIHRAPAREEVEVLMRVVVTESIQTDEGFNSKIVDGNNTQNVIKDSDFRANDTIQRWLAENLENREEQDNLPKFHYSNKRRGSKGPGKLGRALKLETLAKIRYAYLHEPVGVHKDVPLLWDAGDDGRYAEAFGVAGNLEPSWSNEVLEECKFIYAVYNWLDENTKESAKEYEGVRPYRVAMRFHDLALIGRHLRTGGGCRSSSEIGRLLTHPPEFERLLSDLYIHTSPAIALAWASCLATGHTAFSLRQGTDYWAEMVRNFSASTGAGVPSDDLLRD